LEEVGVMGVGDVMRRARLTWVAKVLRMGWERPPKMVLCGKYEGGKRPRGKPVTRWTEKVEGDLKGMDMGVKFIARVVKDEKKWEKVFMDKYGYGKRGKGEKKGKGKKKGKGEIHTCRLCGKEMTSLGRFLAHRCGEEEVRGEEKQKEPEVPYWAATKPRSQRGPKKDWSYLNVEGRE
jgi:hypothetical protein